MCNPPARPRFANRHSPHTTNTDGIRLFRGRSYIRFRRIAVTDVSASRRPKHKYSGEWTTSIPVQRQCGTFEAAQLFRCRYSYVHYAS